VPRRAGDPRRRSAGGRARPGLLGRIFDGVQRPLPALAAHGDFLARGVSHPALDRELRRDFEPRLRPGDELRAGQLLGLARDPAGRAEPVLSPPGASGRVAEVRAGPARCPRRWCGWRAGRRSP